MILIPLPHYGFDPTEAAIPWQFLTDRGIKVCFSTPNGTPASADRCILTGNSFGIFKKILMATNDAIIAYKKMIESPEFKNPISYTHIDVNQYSGIILPGGHDKHLKVYLESEYLQSCIRQFFEQNKIVGAICHGTLLVSRTKNKEGNSVIQSYKTTSLLKVQELSAFLLTCLWKGNYYRTYSTTVESEVKSALEHSSQFISGDNPFFRDSSSNMTKSLTVCDRNYISARWPGDANKFAWTFFNKLQSNQ